MLKSLFRAPCVFAVVTLCSSIAVAHDGPDKNPHGCHLDGTRYHCHLVAWLEIYGVQAITLSENSENQVNCTDFPNQAEAQAFFERHNPAQDPHLLDADKDFLACESRPAPQSPIMRQALIDGWVN